MAARLSAFVIWALVAAGAVFWGYRFWIPPTAMPANAQLVAEGPPPRGDLTRLFGAAPVAAAAPAEAPVAESSRFRLVGVLAPKPSGEPVGPAVSEGTGVALIAVDGKPPRAYVVGSSVDGDLVLLSVTHRSASLGAGDGVPGIVLELPPLPPPSTGTLPRAVAGDAPRVAPPGSMAAGPAPGPAAAPRVPGAAPLNPMRPPTMQAQRPAAPAPAADADDDEEAPATSAPTLRPGAPATR